MLICGAASGLQTARSAEVVAKDVNAELDKSATMFNGYDVKDPNALEVDKVAALINAALRLRALKETSNLSVQQAKISNVLLEGAKIMDSLQAWPQDLITALYAQANYFDGLVLVRDPPLSFRRLATSMQRTLGSGPLTLPTDITLAQSLATQLFAKAPPAEKLPHASATEAATDLIKSVVDNKALFLEDPALRQKLIDLRQKLAVYEQHVELRVHILGALYGDINAINALVSETKGATKPGSHSRWCIASAAVATNCERKADCTLAGSDFRKDACGFDPAEFLHSSSKALVVWYTCRPNSDEFNWNGLSGEATATFNYHLARRGQRAVLYSSNQSFACKAMPK